MYSASADDPLHVDRAGRHAAYIRVARDVIHVVGRERAHQGRSQHRQPWRWLEALQVGRRDEKRDPARIDPLTAFEVGAG